MEADLAHQRQRREKKAAQKARARAKLLSTTHGQQADGLDQFSEQEQLVTPKQSHPEQAESTLWEPFFPSRLNPINDQQDLGTSGIARQASGSSTGFGQGAKRPHSPASQDARDLQSPTFQDAKLPHSPTFQDTPKYSTEKFASPRSSLDPTEFAGADEVLSSFLESMSHSSGDRSEGGGLPPPPPCYSYWSAPQRNPRPEDSSAESQAAHSSGGTDGCASTEAPFPGKTPGEAIENPLSKAEQQALALRMEGNALYGKGQYKQALNSYLRAHQALPSNLCIHANLAATYVKLDMYSQAVKQVESAEKYWDAEISQADCACLMDMHWWQHLAHWILGNRQEALKSLRMVMHTAPLIHNHTRFATAVRQHRKLREILEADEVCLECDEQDISQRTLEIAWGMAKTALHGRYGKGRGPRIIQIQA